MLAPTPSKMSFIKNTAIPIGLFILVIIFGCLLWNSSSHTGSMSAKSSVVVPTKLQGNIVNTASTSSLPVVNGISYEIVSTSVAQERGLGGRASIPNNYAMLFVFPTDDTYGFWMKDMLTSIDMIWLSDSGKIVAVNGSVPANSYPDVFNPPQPVKYVLETRAGFAQSKGWKVGTTVTLPLPYGK